MSNPQKTSSSVDNNTNNAATNENDFPGYPSHPASEDIMNQKNVEKVSVDMDNFSRSGKANEENTTEGQPKEDKQNTYVSDDEGDVTPEEQALLASTDAAFPDADDDRLADAKLDNTDEDGELLNEYDDDRDIDVPGSDDDNDMEDIGEEDEENNYYSLGGDRQEGLEESKE